ncbi:tripartite tricarboxylate transporter substrate binding protein [Roseomonas hellenica]|uniref:Tripartite tricarboxylate transporter substrate binding protein n=1 Tax=Plastoroseomonas hellenica TaxID=2687306 RepID=A0ABS5EXN6_9PROT|nr:tripartite tricarboxylate transporter substrate-binding protein [Plastoroseomonas hellenica]MBR0665072.1 tripartite tricarboxylate transporter substrate binding protein [Plastoroseomonas hellenica]
MPNLVPSRRAVLSGLACAALAGVAAAQPARWPNRTIRFIVPFAPGGPVEVPARFIADHLAPRLGQPVIVEARPGAGGALGIQLVAQSTDQHSLVFTTGSVAILPSLQKNPGYDPFRDLTPVSVISESAMAINVRRESPIRDLDDLLARARAAPGRITYGSSGVGTTTHLLGELLKVRAQIDLLHVPFRGTGQGLGALYAGDVDLLLTDASVPIPHIRDGRMRSLAVSSAEPTAALPGVPAVASAVPGFSMVLWFALLGPANLPREAVERLTREMAPLRDGSALAQRLEAAGGKLLLTGPEELADRLRREVPLWRQVAEAAGIRPEE